MKTTFVSEEPKGLFVVTIKYTSMKISKMTQCPKLLTQMLTTKNYIMSL